MTNEQHAENARKSEAECDFKSAAKHWWSAKARTIGHKKRDRYELMAEACERKCH